MCKIKNTIIEEQDKRNHKPISEPKKNIIWDTSDWREALGSFERADDLKRQMDSNPFN